MSKSFTFKLFYLTGIWLLASSVNIWAQSSNTENAQMLVSPPNQAFFIENQGQWSDEVLYKMSIGGLDAWISLSGVVYDFYLNQEVETPKSTIAKDWNTEKTWQRLGQVIEVKLKKPNLPDVHPSGTQATYYNYFMGKNAKEWVNRVALHQEIRLENIFDHIDLKYYFDQGYLRYDYIVKPKGNPADIQFEIKGCEDYFVNDEGELVLTTRFGAVKQKQLELYQMINDQKVIVDGQFVQTKAGIKFSVGKYDKSKELIIDPLVWSSFIGGTADEVGKDMALDANNNIYITGYTQAAIYPTKTGSYDIALNGGAEDVFLSKLTANGRHLEYTSFIGGLSSERGEKLVLDQANNIYILGSTSSTDFPSTNDAFRESLKGKTDVFVCQLDASGTNLNYSTFIGGSDNDIAQDINLDKANNIYLTGYTTSTDFPISSTAYQAKNNGGLDAFVCKLDAGGKTLQYSSYFGGGKDDRASGIALDKTNNIYFTGSTNSGNDFPVTKSAYNSKHQGASDIFIMKLDANGTKLAYASLIGGTKDDVATGLIVDELDQAYLYGFTQSDNFPSTTGAYRSSKTGATDGYLLKLNASGSELVLSTLLGGSAEDFILDGTIDKSRNIYLTGYTQSSDFPTTANAHDLDYNALKDAFVMKLDAAAKSLLYASFLGGEAEEKGWSIAVDSKNNVSITGATRSLDYPVTEGSFDRSYNGSLDIFVSQLDISLAPCLANGITFKTQTEIDNFSKKYPACTSIQGDVIIKETIAGNITNLNGLANIESITGDLYFDGNAAMSNIAGLAKLRSIGGALRIQYTKGLNDLKGLENLRSIGGDLILNKNSFVSLAGIKNLKDVGGSLKINNNAMLFNLSGLNSLHRLGGNIEIYNNQILLNISALAKLESIAGSIFISQNPSLTSLQGLQNIAPSSIRSSSGEEDVVVENNASLFDCAVQSICDILLTASTTTKIKNNATNCNNDIEILAICAPLTGVLNLSCSEDLSLTLPTGQSKMSVSWDEPRATSTCDISNANQKTVTLSQIEGLASGTDFSAGKHIIRYRAADNCDNVEECGFTITIIASPELPSVSSSEDCPSEIASFNKIGTYNGHAYYISDEEKRWEEAQRMAENLGGHLVTLNSQAENDFLQARLASIDEMVYIGYSDAEVEGAGTWVNGDPIALDLSFNNTNENDYAVMNFWAGTWGMNSKWVKKRFIMELACSDAPAKLSLTCPDDIRVSTREEAIVVDWEEATAITTCALSNHVLMGQVEGYPSGSEFSVGMHSISYEGIDACDNTQTCSFNIHVEEQGASNCIKVLDGFTKLGEFEGHGYYISEEARRWEDAKLIAENLGAHLVTMNSQAENDFLQSSLRAKEETVYIGYSDVAKEATGTWANDDPVAIDLSFNNTEENDYAVMNFWAGTWDMTNYWVKKKFVIELDCAINRAVEEETVQLTNSFTLKVNPNPAKDFIRLKMESMDNQNVQVELYTINGQQIYSAKKELEMGKNEMIISLNNVPSGFFLLQISGQDFKETRKLVKE